MPNVVLYATCGNPATYVSQLYLALLPKSQFFNFPTNLIQFVCFWIFFFFTDLALPQNSFMSAYLGFEINSHPLLSVFQIFS